MFVYVNWNSHKVYAGETEEKVIAQVRDQLIADAEYFNNFLYKIAPKELYRLSSEEVDAIFREECEEAAQATITKGCQKFEFQLG